jgi:hypothetical protein
METEIDQLLEMYGKIYQTRTRDFNVLTTVHLSENDHTNILCEILNMKVGDTKPFMESFVQDVLGITIKDMDSQNFVAKTQEQAISAKGLGFIDLLIKSNDKLIIVENKVCGAGDGPFQLARYYFSYVQDDTYFEELIKSVWKEFKLSNKFVENLQKQYEEWWQGGYKADKPYLVYLTDVADKEPSENSLPIDLKSKLDDHYIHISYEEDIYDWLKNKVLPKIQYGKTGGAHNSIILYLRELENILGANNSKNEWYISQQEKVANIVEDVFSLRQKYADNDDGLYKYWNEIYNQIDSSLKKAAYKDNVILADLRDCILCYRDSIYGKYAPNGWRVYCAPKYITFYPLYWLERFGGSKTSCVHFAIDNWCKGTPMIMLKIHGSACKQYMTITECTFKSRVSDLNNFGLFSNTSEYKNYDDTNKKFQKSNHYYFNLEIKLKQMEPSLEWKRDSQASDNFFSKFIENDAIKQLVKYIDDNFK